MLKKTLVLIVLLFLLFLASPMYESGDLAITFEPNQPSMVATTTIEKIIPVDTQPVGVVIDKITLENIDLEASPASTEMEIIPVVVADEEAILELDVDFASQAPFANWDALHQEACEEASMATVAMYFSGQKLDETIMDQEILSLYAWEQKNGYAIDLSASQTADILGEYYGLNARVVTEVTVSRIKEELDMGHLVIAPLAGRLLGNPYFTSPGPIYHMLVIRGYDSDEFITNEVGTKRGDGFRYKYNILINAVHDWNIGWSHYGVTDAQMEARPKAVIVVSK
jgi:hypothetical protein